MDNEMNKNLPQKHEVWTEEDHARLRAKETAFDPDIWEAALSREQKERAEHLTNPPVFSRLPRFVALCPDS